MSLESPLRNWSIKKVLAGLAGFVIVALVLREFAGWAADLLRSMHGGGGGH
jgi:hypothetical protein